MLSDEHDEIFWLETDWPLSISHQIPRLFADFSTGDGDIAFDVCFDDNITYSIGCFIHAQENHHLCKKLLCQYTSPECLQRKTLKYQKMIFWRITITKLKPHFIIQCDCPRGPAKTDDSFSDFSPFPWLFADHFAIPWFSRWLFTL